MSDKPLPDGPQVSSGDSVSNEKSTRSSGSLWIVIYFLSVAATASIFTGGLNSLTKTTSNRHLPGPQIYARLASLPDWIYGLAPPPLVAGVLPIRVQKPEDLLEPAQVRDLVIHTKGYYARDWDLGITWDNVRTIIEGAALHAKLLNRTLILPSYIYTKSCEYQEETCSNFAKILSVKTQNKPDVDTMVWRVPTTEFVNMTHLRLTQPAILTSEYLALHGFLDGSEVNTGYWAEKLYHSKPNIFETDKQKAPTLFVVENSKYEPARTIRVDEIPLEMKARGNWNRGAWGKPAHSGVSDILRMALTEGIRALPFEEVGEVLNFVANNEKDGGWKALGFTDYDETTQVGVPTDEQLEKFVLQHGWEVLYTYEGMQGIDDHAAKFGVTRLQRYFAPRDYLRGLKEEFGHITHDVLLFKGTLHVGRKPGFLQFTTTASRDAFTQLVHDQIRPRDIVLELARRIDERMTEMNGGRMWMAGHLRVKGDKTLEQQFELVKQGLNAGRETLRAAYSLELSVESDQFALQPSSNISSLPFPEPHDKFYLANHLRDAGSTTYLTQHGAVLINDLLTPEDRRDFGWALMITDVLATVEQAVLARAAYFHGSLGSSASGGVINMRAALGRDPRTAVLA